MRTVTDQMGRTVSVPEIPGRIISLVPSQTELLFDLGLADRIIGQTLFCVHPEPAFKTAVKIGGTKKLQLDKIRDLQPDLIIGNKEENDREQILALEKEFPVWMSDIVTLEDALQMILMLGDLSGKGEEARQMEQQIRQEFRQLPPPPSKPLSALYLIWREPWMAAGRNTFIDKMLQAAGFENAISGADTRYPELTSAEMAALDPDVVFLSSEPYPFSEKHLHELSLILPGTPLRLVDGEMFSWYGSRLRLAPAYFAGLRASF